MSVRSQSARSSKRLRVEPLEGREVPATFTVTTFADVVDPADGKLSLREAVDRANANPGPDVIQLKAGVYLRAPRPGSEDANTQGDFDVTDSVTISGAGPSATVITGNRNDRMFELFGPISVTFSNLAMRGGGNRNVDGGAVQALFADITLNNCIISQMAGHVGGAINAESGSVTVRNSRLAYNRASDEGGAIRANTGRLVVDRSMVIGNSAATVGGGIFSDAGPATISRSTVMLNTAGFAGGGIDVEDGDVTLTATSVRGNLAGTDGGGIYTEHQAVLTNCFVTGNRAATGAGGGVRADSATVRGTTISGNSCQIFGGGLSAQSATLTTSTVSGNTAQEIGGGISVGDLLTLANSTVSGNSAGREGGGVAADRVVLTNVTLSGNMAGTGPDGEGLGGGISANTGTILNCTIVENRTVGTTSSLGAGVASANTGTDLMRVKNTIIADNLGAFGEEQDVSGDYLSLGNNLIGVVDGTSTGFGAPGDVLGADDNPLDPGLGDLAFNGGPTKTHALLAGSPAIDHGNNLGAPATDQRGLPRIKDGDGNGSPVVDIGAFER